MAQNLNIKINIKQIGLNVFDDILNKIQEVSKALATTDLTSLKGLSEIGKNLQSSFEDIKKSLKNVGEVTEETGDFIKEVVSDVINNSLKTLSSGTQKGLNTSIKTMESFLAKVSLGVAAITTYTLASMGLIFQNISLGNYKIISLVNAFGKVTLVPLFNFINLEFLNITKSFWFLGEGVSALLEKGYNIIPFLQGISRFSLALFSKALLFNVLFLSWFSGVKFFKRLIGLGMNVVSPLERVVNLITTLDKATGRLYLTVFHFFKMVSFGVLTFIAPLIGIFPLLNSMVDIVVRPLTNYLDRVGIRLGSSRSSLIVIFQTLRKMFAVATPALKTFVDQMALINKISSKTGENMKKITKKTKGLEGISRLKFPFMVQIQAFISKLEKYLPALFQQLTQITMTLQQTANIGKEQIDTLYNAAKSKMELLQIDAKKGSDSIFNYILIKEKKSQNIFVRFSSFVTEMIMGLVGIIFSITVGLFKNIFVLGKGIVKELFSISLWLVTTIFAKSVKLFYGLFSVMNDILDFAIKSFETFSTYSFFKIVSLFHKIKNNLTGMFGWIFSTLASGLKRGFQFIVNIFKLKKPSTTTEKKETTKEEAFKKEKILDKKIIGHAKKIVEEKKKIQITGIDSWTHAEKKRIWEAEQISKAEGEKIVKEIEIQHKLQEKKISEKIKLNDFEKKGIKEVIDLEKAKILDIKKGISVSKKVTIATKEEITQFNVLKKAIGETFHTSLLMDFIGSQKKSIDLTKGYSKVLERVPKIFQDIGAIAVKEMKKVGSSIIPLYSDLDKVIFKTEAFKKSVSKAFSKLGTKTLILPDYSIVLTFLKQFNGISKIVFIVLAQFFSILGQLFFLNKKNEQLLSKVLVDIILVAQQVSLGKKQVSSLNNKLVDLFGIMLKILNTTEGILKNYPMLIGMLDTIRRYINKIKKVSFLNIDFKKMRRGLQKLIKELDRLEKKGLITGKTLGEKISSMLAKGLNANNKDMLIALGELTNLITSFFPQSPAKRGPLKNLVKMGAKIVYYLVQGMLSKLSYVYRAAFQIAEIIAKFFPRSLPLLGPLVTIVSSGMLIPYYLAKGMLKGVGYVKQATSNISKTIIDTLKKASELGFLAERIGISIEKLSALENVLADVGATSSDLSFVFTRMRDTLNKTFDIKELAKVKALGIDLEEIKKSGDPLINLFLQVSEALKKVPITSKKAKDALALLGVTTHSKLINVLLKGKDEIKELMKEGVRLGTTYDSVFMKMAKKITGLFNRIKRVKDFILVDFIKDLLPKLEKFLKDVLKLIEKNRITIQAFLKITYEALVQVFRLLKSLIVFTITQPDKAFNFIRNSFNAFYIFVLDVLNSLLGIVSKELLNFFIKLGITLIKIPYIILSNMFTGINSSMKFWLLRIFINILISLSEFADSVVIFFKNFGKNITKALFGTLLKAIVSFFGTIGRFFKAIGGKIYGAFLSTTKKIKKLQKNLAVSGGMTNILEDLQDDLNNAEKKIKPVTKTIVEDVKKVFLELGKATKDSEKHLDKITKKSKEAFEKIKTSFQTLISDLKKGAKFLPDEFGKQILKFEKILSKVNFEKIKLGLEAEKNKQLDNINKIDKKRTESVNTQKINHLEIAKFIKNIEERIAFDSLSSMDRKNEEERRKLVEKHIKELKAFRQLTEDKGDIAKLFAVYKIEMDKIASKQSEEIWRKNLAMMGGIAGNLEQMFTSAYENTGKEIKELFYASKVAAIAQATINKALAITTALGYGGPLGIAQAAVLSAIAGMEIAKIMSQTLSFNLGGKVPGMGNKDTVSAKLTPGEYVMPKGTVQHYGAGLMEAIRNKMFPKNMLATISANIPAPYTPPQMAFAVGGLVPNSSQEAEAKQDINIVNVIDPNLLDKYLSSSSGQKQILNVLSANKYSVKRIIT